MKQPTQPLFTVSVTSRLVGVSPGTLRRWESHGLMAPVREGRGRRRLYTWREIERAQQIRYLVLRRHIRLDEVKAQLRLIAARPAVRPGEIPPVAEGTPLVSRVALALAR